MQAIKNTIEEKNKISKLKRNSEFSKTNRIRLELFSFEKNEIKEKQKQKKENELFSFLTKINDEKAETKKVEFEKVEPKFITKQISLDSKKTTNDSFSSDMDDSDSEESSEMSCVEEEEI